MNRVGPGNRSFQSLPTRSYDAACPSWQQRPESLPTLPGVHDLWRSGVASVGAGRGTARPFIREALEAGIDFFDSADIYSTGESERILGRALRDFAQREDLVIATKAFFPERQAQRLRLVAQAPACQRGCLAAAVGYGLPGSLRDPSLRSGHPDRGNLRNPRQPGARRQGPLPRRLVDAGLALHEDARLPAPPRPGAIHLDAEPVQPDRSRDEEDLVPLCREEGIALTPWSPLARGLLAGARSAGTLRTRTDEQAPRWYGGREKSSRPSARWRNRRSPRASTGATRPGLAAWPERCRRADRRPVQAASPRGCPRGADAGPRRRGVRHAGGAAHGARPDPALVGRTSTEKA